MQLTERYPHAAHALLWFYTLYLIPNALALKLTLFVPLSPIGATDQSSRFQISHRFVDGDPCHSNHAGNAALLDLAASHSAAYHELKQRLLLGFSFQALNLANILLRNDCPFSAAYLKSWPVCPAKDALDIRFHLFSA